jgi:membrane protease YdiL (CAAX protease family)
LHDESVAFASFYLSCSARRYAVRLADPSQFVVITVFGCLFGLLAQWRQSLRPGMISHFLQDALPLVLPRLQG